MKMVAVLECNDMIWCGQNMWISDYLGYIPEFLSERDERGAVEQLNENYVSGWRKFNGFELTFEDGNKDVLGGASLQYPNDPPTRELARTVLHDKETIIVFEHSWVVVIDNATGSFEVARMG